MRRSLLLLLGFLAVGVQAEPAKPADFQHAFDLVGIRLLCEQSGPLIQRGLSPAQQERANKAFNADALCDDLAHRLAPKLTATQLGQAISVLESPLAQRFTEAERAVGEGSNVEGLANYREQLSSRPPRAERVALVQRLDKAAHTTELATLLRYEVGKTQALLALREKGQDLSEAKLSTHTAKQVDLLRESSAQAVASFMLYAYRQMPSGELTDYAQLYEQEPVSQLLAAAVKELPAVFADRRAALK